MYSIDHNRYLPLLPSHLRHSCRYSIWVTQKFSEWISWIWNLNLFIHTSAPSYFFSISFHYCFERPSKISKKIRERKEEVKKLVCFNAIPQIRCVCMANVISNRHNGLFDLWAICYIRLWQSWKSSCMQYKLIIMVIVTIINWEVIHQFVTRWTWIIGIGTGSMKLMWILLNWMWSIEF